MRTTSALALGLLAVDDVSKTGHCAGIKVGDGGVLVGGGITRKGEQRRSVGEEQSGGSKSKRRRNRVVFLHWAHVRGAGAAAHVGRRCKPWVAW
jgi:hypothetical protein